MTGLSNGTSRKPVMNETYNKNYENIKILESEKPKAYYITYMGKPCSVKKEFDLGHGPYRYLPKVMTKLQAINKVKKLNDTFNTEDFNYEEL